MTEKDRIEKLEDAIGKIRAEAFKLRHAIALILQDLKD
jgi:hypothetical protein